MKRDCDKNYGDRCASAATIALHTLDFSSSAILCVLSG